MPTPPCEPDATAVTPVGDLPGYALADVIGCGGVGTVYRGRQLALDRPVAVKVIRPDRTDAPNVVARFEAEATILGRLCHPNIVRLHDLVRHDGRLFLVMELLDGEDLGRRVRRAGPCDERLAWAVTRQAAEGLAHAAAHGVVHRDVKPSNLFLTPPGGADPDRSAPRVKVMDFGLAKWATGSPDDLLTEPGTVLGTPAYMAPEQSRGAAAVDHRADIYSLGATVYHALAGRPPFEGATVWEVMARKHGPAPRLGSPVSRPSADLVAAMMAPDPAARIGSYRELIDRIDGVLAAKPADPIDHPGRPRRRLTACLVGAAVLTTVWAVERDRLASPFVLAAGSGPVAAGPRPVPTGEHFALFDGASLDGWQPQGGVWRVAGDEEGVKVLAGSGKVRRPFEVTADYRLIVGLDLHQASAVEVQLGPGDVGGAYPTLRVSRADGATFGMRVGDGRTFRAAGQPVPFPSPGWFEGRSPYLEVRLERAGDRWSAWFNGQEAGWVDAPEPAAGLRVVAEGGAARIDSAVVTTLKRE